MPHQPSPEAGLLADASTRIERVLARFEATSGMVPFYGPTDLAGMPADTRQALLHAEADAYRRRPETSALHFCLTSASALLDVCQILLLQQHQHPDASAQDRERDWKELASCTKVAGRSAYRAALILADPVNARAVAALDRAGAAADAGTR